METIKTIIHFFSTKQFQLALAVVQYMFAAIGMLQSQCDIQHGGFENWDSFYATETATNPGHSFLVDAPSFERPDTGTRPTAKPSAIPFDIYPVPAADVVKLRPRADAPMREAIFVQIFNGLGQVVFEVKSAEIPDRIDIGHLADGMYTMKVSTPQESWTTMWMKQ